MLATAPGDPGNPVARAAMVVLASCVVCTGCAGWASTTTRSPTHARSVDPPFVPTDRATYTPPPRARGRTGTTAALVVASGEAQARATALTFVRGLLEGDRATVQTLFAERVVHAVDGQQMPRDSEVERCLGGADLLTYEPDLVVEDLIDVDAIEIMPAGRYHDRMPVPPGIEQGDLVVSLPPQRGGGDAARIPCLARIYVRPGAQPRVVGLTR